MFIKSILTSGQRRWFWFIAITSVFLTSNGFYLWAFDSVDFYYMANVLAHLGVGFLFAIPFIAFTVLHYWTARRTRNAKSKWMGYFLFAVVVTALGTGLYLTVDGVRKNEHWVLIVHIASSFLGIASFTMHRLTSTHKVRLGLATLRETGIILAGFLVLTGAYELFRVATPTEAVADNKKATFAPSPFTTTTGKYLNGEAFNDNESCRDCHPDAYKQWQSSIHAKAAFNTDPFHRRTFEYMMRTSPPALVRFCAACHDPIILASGELDTMPTHFTFSSYKYANTSISCNACHAIQSVDLRGNGQYTLGQPVEYPFAHSTSDVGKFLNYLLIKVKPEAHTNSLTKPFFKKAEFCAACHKLAVPEAVNHYKWMRGQDQYDGWNYSGMSGNSAVSWYSAPKPFGACQDCHMKEVPSNEFGSENGMVPNHWTPAASSELAILTGDTSWLHRVESFLKDNRVSVDLFGAIVDNQNVSSKRSKHIKNIALTQAPPSDARTGEDLIAPLNAYGTELAVNEPFRLECVIRTRNVGHKFPEGTMDINEVWLKVIAKDANGKVFFTSGEINPKTDDVDTTAHFVRTRLFTVNDTLIERHNVNDWTGSLYNRTIPPGSAQTVHYRMTIPKTAGDHITIIAQVHYRKFDKTYTDFALQGIDTSQFPAHIPYDITMTTDTVTVSVGDHFNRPQTSGQNPKLRERFNDYGIGLFVQEDMRGAQNAFQRAFHFDTSYADAYINLARIDLQEGNLPAMAEELDRAEKIKPDYYKTHYFRGVWDKMNGKLDDAAREFDIVYDRFPFDRNTITTLAQVHYLKGEYATALEWCNKEFAIDPEDFTAHYQAFLCYNALGQPDSAALHREAYMTFRDDERVNEYALTYRVKHPSDNNEANPIHEHLNSMLINDMKRKLPPKKLYSETK
jgi:tetratricopeptide (TPR) repeat protein